MKSYRGKLHDLWIPLLDNKRYLLTILVAVTFFLCWSQKAQAAVFLGDEKLPNDRISVNNQSYVALNDLASSLDLSITSDGLNLLISNTHLGSLIVDPQKHTAFSNDVKIDFQEKMIQKNGIWYVPERFLSLVLGLHVQKTSDDDRVGLILHPKIIAIIPTKEALYVRATSKLKSKSFTLENPARRVIDFEGYYLGGPNLNLLNEAIQIAGVKALRASQFSLSPPCVRIVIEWDDNKAPKHAIKTNNKVLSILLSNSAPENPPATGVNLLTGITFTNTNNIKPANNQIEIQKPPISAAEIQPSVYPPESNPSEKLEQPSSVVSDETANLPAKGKLWTVQCASEKGNTLARLYVPFFKAINDFTLADKGGMRIVIDLNGTKLEGSERILNGKDEIKRIRIAQFQSDITRIVLDLSKVTAYNIDSDPKAGLITVKLLSGNLKGKTIVIDPGHGGEDPGAVVNGTMEKHLNLQMAMMLKNFLEQAGARVFLTRSTDIYITLANRVEFAKQKKADLFVCIHNNATEGPTILQGSMILYNNPRWLPLYRLVHRGIAARTGVPGLGPFRDERGLFILRRCEVPVLFVEAAFLTNNLDFTRLTDPSGTYSRNIMMGVMDGILAYFEGRDLPPVVYPQNLPIINEKIFDLGGKPLFSPGDQLVQKDEGSAWDSSSSESNVDASSEETSQEKTEDESQETEDNKDSDDKENEYHKKRGRGSYRYN